MAHTKESIAKMLASRAKNKAAKRRAAGRNGHNGHNGNGAGPDVPMAIVLLTQVTRTMPKRHTDLSENDLSILGALRALTRKAARPAGRPPGRPPAVPEV